MPDAVTDQVTRALPGLIELRRDLHKNPELGFYETRTAGIIADRLNAAGMAVKAEVGGTGVVGVLDTGRPGPTLMIRADIDALPVSEPGPPIPRKAHTAMNARKKGAMA